ncbi:MAG: tRNA (adenosine(37)-N6)-threonylcarbamoyltransferase complex transferase subunit TsaD [Candidatus Pacebacteria bacterium]|nr:tRNA (adenosine(37)-N6)-threonylcarbamoyltransferase complex transferase subunit TsaD [Candidatus Paceibacterota bacterium]
MKILSIETSCDETAISILEAKGVFGDAENPVKFKILANTLISQIDIHKEYGGVFPALAKREHAKNLIPILRKTLEEAKLNNQITKTKNPWESNTQVEEILERESDLLKLFLEYIPTIKIPEIDAIAITQGPGLEPALWVGINFAKALSLVWKKPLIPVNHMEGHLLSSFIGSESKTQSQKSKEIEFPAIGLLISGGHTELILMEKFREYKKIGQTRDDAIGEAFDKVARMMDLPYPGGPEISKLAQIQREKQIDSVPSTNIKLPRPMLNTDNFDFSFSGLKTAVLYLIKNLKKDLLAGKAGNSRNELPEEIKEEIALEFENAVTEILLKKSEKAIAKYQAKTLILGGGVIANNHIRQSFESLSSRGTDLEILIPEREFSTDNAIMIGIAGYFKYMEQNPKPLIGQKKKGQLQTATDLVNLQANGNLKL